jgi:hypothetical protein
MRYADDAHDADDADTTITLVIDSAQFGAQYREATTAPSVPFRREAQRWHFPIVAGRRKVKGI